MMSFEFSANEEKSTVSQRDTRKMRNQEIVKKCERLDGKKRSHVLIQKTMRVNAIVEADVECGSFLLSNRSL